MNDNENRSNQHGTPPSGSPQTAAPRLSSEDLFHGKRELIIEHSGEEYRLRITSRGKLILTK